MNQVELVEFWKKSSRFDKKPNYRIFVDELINKF